MRRLAFLLLAAGVFAASLGGLDTLRAADTPRLLVTVVVDQLRADYLQQFRDPAGKVQPEALRTLLQETAGHGFAQLAGVVDPDTWGIAVPVRDARNRTVAALGVVVPLREMRLQALVPALQTAARGIGRQLQDPRATPAFHSAESL